MKTHSFTICLKKLLTVSVLSLALVATEATAGPGVRPSLGYRPPAPVVQPYNGQQHYGANNAAMGNNNIQGTPNAAQQSPQRNGSRYAGSVGNYARDPF